MKRNENENTTPTVNFENNAKVGDTITALVNHFTGQLLGEFVLEKALEKVKENNEKLEAFKKELLEVEE